MSGKSDATCGCSDEPATPVEALANVEGPNAKRIVGAPTALALDVSDAVVSLAHGFHAGETSDPTDKPNFVVTAPVERLGDGVAEFGPGNVPSTPRLLEIEEVHEHWPEPGVAELGPSMTAVKDRRAEAGARGVQPITHLGPGSSGEERTDADLLRPRPPQCVEQYLLMLSRSPWPEDRRIEGAAARDLIAQWQHLSRLTILARSTVRPSLMNDELLAASIATAATPLGPLCLLWAADSLTHEMRYEEAIDLYREYEQRFGARYLLGHPLLPTVLTQMAECYARLGRAEEAVAAYERMLRGDLRETSPLATLVRAGSIAEEFGHHRVATHAYERACGLDDPLYLDDPSIAARHLARARGARAPFADLGALARRVAKALARHDVDELNALASPSLFEFGLAGSEMTYGERGELLRLLADALKASRVEADPSDLSGGPCSACMRTDGWRGDLIVGTAFFTFTASVYGWEWTGVALTSTPTMSHRAAAEHQKRFFDSEKVRTQNQRLPISIRAPWGASAAFRAGGAVGAALAGEFLTGILYPIAVALSHNPCGYGTPGAYYAASPASWFPAHNGQLAFSIDFTRNRPGIPFSDGASFLPVAAVAAGLVVPVGGFASMVPRDTNPPGFGAGNTCNIAHVTEEDASLVRPGGKPRFISNYQHMMPNLAVSVGMAVRQGEFLGAIDSTGASRFSHLHFAMHDRTLRTVTDPNRLTVGVTDQRGGTTRPTPMGAPPGTTLNDNEFGKCIVSDNFIPR